MDARARERVNEIDLLRFLAALAVVVYHYAFRGTAGADPPSVMGYAPLAGWAKYGYLGVELFFMISGFVILMSASSGSLRAFVVSRVTRLYPAYWACATATFLAIALWGAPRDTASVWRYLANLTMLNGFAGIRHLDGSYWSLLVELKFYVMVAAVLLLGRIQQARAFLAAWLAVAFAVELVPEGRLHYALDLALTTDFAAYFIAGAAAYLMWSEGVSPSLLGLYGGSWLDALHRSRVEALHESSLYGTSMSLPAVAVIVSVFFAVMLLVALRRTGPLRRLRWAAAGALTYPLYLLHQKIGFIAFNRLYPALSEHLLFWGAVGLMLAAAWAVHLHVERRFAPRLKAAAERLLDGLARVPAAAGAAR
jgi:peptidoglycan/LPS O-acetylase OafA/YrhL